MKATAGNTKSLHTHLQAFHSDLCNLDRIAQGKTLGGLDAGKRKADAQRPSVLGLMAAAHKSQQTEKAKAEEAMVIAFVENSISDRVLDTHSFKTAMAKSLDEAGISDRKSLATAKKSVAGAVRSCVNEQLAGKDVWLLMDSASLNRRRLLSFTIGIRGSVFFWKSVRVGVDAEHQQLRQEDVRRIVENEILEIKNLGAYVFALVADNASNFQVAMEEFEPMFVDDSEDGTQVMATQDMVDKGDVEMPDEATAVNAALSVAERHGIFRFQCACHSIQLIIKDLCKNIKVCEEATAKMKQITDIYYQSPEKMMLLTAKQKQLHPEDTPKTLVKPSKTRWNSITTSWARMLEVEEALLAIAAEKGGAFVITKGDFKKIRTAYYLTHVFAVSTRKIELASATVLQVAAEIEVWKSFVSKLKETPRWISVGKKVEGIVQARIDKHLSNDPWACYEVLRLDKNQLALPTLKRTEITDVLKNYVQCFAERRGLEISDHELTCQIGTHLMRTCGADMNYEQYWTSKVLGWVALASFALALGSCIADESQVERNFSREGIVYSRLRVMLNDSTRNDEMHIVCNHCQLFRPEQHEEREDMRRRRSLRARAMADIHYEALRMSINAPEVDYEVA